MDKDRKLIESIFKQARKDLYYPPIVNVELTDIETSEIDFSGRSYSILVGKDMISKLSEKALLGIFHHELSHWTKHPYDAKTIILEDHFLKGIPNKNSIRNLYDDVVVNLDLIINRGLREVVEVYRELPAISKIDRLLREFYRTLTGLDFGDVRLEEELRERLMMLNRIDFLNMNKVRIKTNIKKFAETIGDLTDEEICLPFNLFSLRDFNYDEIKKAMRHIAEEITPQEYKEIAIEVLNELKKEPGISPAEESLFRELERPDTLWYRIRAQKYAVYIEALSKKDSLYPNELKDFELDDNIDTFSPIESYGKILPGLAKRYHLEEFEGHDVVSLPSAVIMLDSSGSMRHPGREISYAVLGAFSIARNYLEHGSKVGVINFSDQNLELNPVRESYKVYEMLRTYQGGGTTVHLNHLKQYVAKIKSENNGGEMDYILITDAGIVNITSVVESLSQLNDRVTIIWIKSDVKDYESFEKNYSFLKEGLPPYVTFVEIEEEKDIPHIAVGKSFGCYAGH
ncbi:MAG: vWA domain-containing protein [Nitrospirota bacterium]